MLPKTGPKPDHTAVCVHNEVPKTVLGRRFLLFAPWCDQGLGVQARNYVTWLRRLRYPVVVYACAPSKVSGKAAPKRMQANAKEWAEEGVTVHYDDRNREVVPHEAVVKCAREHNLTDALMLETCHRNIFVVSAALTRSKLRVYAVPNIELVREAELPYFREGQFHRVLCSNEFTYQVLRQLGVRRLAHFPFAIEDSPETVPLAETHMRGESVRFMLVGGMNAERRKQASKVIAAFQRAWPSPTTKATLTVLCQGADALKCNVCRPDVRLVVGHRSYQDIMQEYANSHVVIMLSRAEGIGLSTHEALRSGCAVLTMSTPLFTQLVCPGVNGYMLKAEVESNASAAARLIGNDDPVIHTHTFKLRTLAAAFRAIAEGGCDFSVGSMQKGARRSFELIFEPARVLNAYRDALSTAPAL
jgi:hypothetical protein